MRTAARLALLSLVAASGLSAVAAPAQAAAVISPARVGNDAVKTFTITGGGTYYDTGHEAVVLHANPANGHADVTGSVTSAGACTGTALVLVSNASCAGPLVFTADTTDLPSGSYQVIETRSDVTKLPAATTTTVDATVAVFAQPRFAASAAVAPASRGQGGTSTITVKGGGFKAGMTASFGAGTTASDLVVASSSQLTVDVKVDPTAATGPRDVVLTSPEDGITAGTKASATLAGGFAVAAAPTVTGISPDTGKVGVKTHVTVTGTGFVSGADFTLSVSQVTVTNVVVASATSLTADLMPNTGAFAGAHPVTVINPDGGQGSLASGFTVIAPPSAPLAVKPVAGDTQVSLTWSAPQLAGTSAVTGYRVTATGGLTPIAPIEVTKTSAVLTGLVNGTAYTFTVAAQNADAGYGIESAAVTSTPKYAVTLTAKPGVLSLLAQQATPVSGTLVRKSGNAPLVGATVTLRYTPQIGASVVHTVTTNASGAWSDKPYAFTYNTFVTASYSGTAVNAAVTTTPFTELVGTRVTVGSPKSGASSSARSTLVITGTTSPNKAGYDIYLFKTIAGGKLQALVRTTVASNGTWVLKVTLSKGSYGLRVGVLKTVGNNPGYSAGFTVHRT